jgi:hypothetical protein
MIGFLCSGSIEAWSLEYDVWDRREEGGRRRLEWRILVFRSRGRSKWEGGMEQKQLRGYVSRQGILWETIVRLSWVNESEGVHSESEVVPSKVAQRNAVRSRILISSWEEYLLRQTQRRFVTRPSTFWIHLRLRTFLCGEPSRRGMRKSTTCKAVAYPWHYLRGGHARRVGFLRVSLQPFQLHTTVQPIQPI